MVFPRSERVKHLIVSEKSQLLELSSPKLRNKSCVVRCRHIALFTNWRGENLFLALNCERDREGHSVMVNVTILPISFHV
jgi:hypothetical protein